MASTTKRRFTDEFKREAVALWKASGRQQTEVASELGIMPTMFASLAAQAAGRQRPAGRLSGEAAGIDDGVAGGPGV